MDMHVRVEGGSDDNSCESTNVGNVVAMCWNEGTPVISRHYKKWESVGLQSCITYMMGLFPWHEWVQAKMPSLLCGLSDCQDSIPFANTIENDLLQDSISSILTNFKRKNAGLIDGVYKGLGKSVSDKTNVISDELSIVGLLNVHASPGHAPDKKQACCVLLLQDMSLFEISKRDLIQMQKYQDTVDRQALLYHKTPYKEGTLDVPGRVIDCTQDSNDILQNILKLDPPRPVIVWHVPLRNVIVIQGMGAQDTKLNSRVRSSHTQSVTPNNEKHMPHMFQNLLDAYHADAS